MERNVDKIKRLEHELGRWRKKVADTAKENEKLREALAQADVGNQETQALVDAVLTAVESRSSSPVRLLRDTDCQSPIRGLYPCGEGGGWAGGILSAAADGMRCGEEICKLL